MSNHNSSSEAPRATSLIRDLRFQVAHRLRLQADFNLVYRKGSRARGRFILLIATPSRHPQAPRMGLSVGRKYSKGAPLRNHAKRIFRESFRHVRAQLPAFDIVVIPLQSGNRHDFKLICDELVTLCQKIERKLEQ